MKPVTLPIALLGLFLLSSAAIAAEPAQSESPQALYAQTNAAIDDSLLCYMVKSDGTVLNLNGICGRNVNPANRSTAPVYSRPPGNLGRLEIFGRGTNAPPCYGLDDQGNRCPSVR